MLKRAFRNLPIMLKLRYLMLFSAVTALIISTVTVLIIDIFRLQNQIIGEVSAVADVIGKNSTNALILSDADSADQMLSSLQVNPDILGAALYDDKGEHFAEFVSDQADRPAIHAMLMDLALVRGAIAAGSPQHDTVDQFCVAVPIKIDGEIVGGLTLIASSERMFQEIRTIIGVALLALMASVLVVLVLAMPMRRQIANPLLHIARSMKEISETKNFSLRVSKESQDEVGDVAEGFNEMLSELQKRDDEITQHRLELENKVTERTNRLKNLNKDLKAALNDATSAKDAAETANKAKSEFLARMSHEIRTPMNGVLGMTELIRGTVLDDRQMHFAETIETSAQTLLTVINDILDFSKIEAGKLSLSHDTFDLTEIVDGIAGMFGEAARTNGLELICSLDAATHRQYIGDPARIRQILINLVGNSIKFTKTGEISLLVTESGRDTQPPMVHFEVRDSGIGMPEESLATIFDSFSQVDGSATRDHGGTGLGLTITRQLIELMNGVISVESEVGKGTCFTFSLPLERTAPVETCEIDHDALRGKRVLIVDDNLTNREILSSQLDNAGAVCTDVSSGSAALRQLKAAAGNQKPFDIVVLDVHMPEMDGRVLARNIREDHWIPSCLIVALSSASDHMQPAMMKKMGINKALTKPVGEAELLDTLVRLVHGNEWVEEGVSPLPGKTNVHGHILLAEDNPVNQEVATAMLTSMGYEVTIAEDGAAVLQQLQKGSFDLILMDYHMPIMDGLQATAEIRKIEENDVETRTPIVALTANAMEGDREKFLSAGMDDYLSKPFTLDALRQVVERFIKDDVQPAVKTADNHPAISQARGPDQVQKLEVDLDAKRLDEIRRLEQDGMPSILQALVSTFTDSTPDQIGQMKMAADEGDLRAVQMMAHTLKSSSATLGASCLSTICEDIEETMDPAYLPPLIANIETTFVDVVEALQAEVR